VCQNFKAQRSKFIRQLDLSITIHKEENMNRISISRLTGIGLTILLSLLLLSASQVIAGEKVKLEGTIQGAKCTHYQVECYNDDNHIALEPDFVLVLPNGEYYFIPNLNRGVKARHAYKKVRIHGELNRQELWVDRMVDLDTKGARSKTTWDWSAQDEFWESR
jgi:hypothetical protein